MIIIIRNPHCPSSRFQRAFSSSWRQDISKRPRPCGVAMEKAIKYRRNTLFLDCRWKWWRCGGGGERNLAPFFSLFWCYCLMHNNFTWRVSPSARTNLDCKSKLYHKRMIILHIKSKNEEGQERKRKEEKISVNYVFSLQKLQKARSSLFSLYYMWTQYTKYRCVPIWLWLGLAL